MITLTAADGTVTTMTEQEFRASRGPRRPDFTLSRKPKIGDYYGPRGNGVEARFTTRGKRRGD